MMEIKSNLRKNADFRTKLYNGVYWVPINTLGYSQYTPEDIKIIANYESSLKKHYITNLFEAIQLLQIGNFQIIDDNYYIIKNNQKWECHKTGEEAFKNNCGCCASIASWLCFVLKYRYEKVGLISVSSLSGNGHVLNYIIHNKKLYIIDVFSMTNKFVNQICPETGLLSDYRKTKLPTSCLFEVADFNSFANFFSKYMFFRSSEYMFFIHNTDYCTPIFTKITNGITYIVHYSKKDVELLSTEKPNKKMQALYANE